MPGGVEEHPERRARLVLGLGRPEVEHPRLGRVEVIDDDMAAAMEKVFETDLSNCVELTQGEWESRDIYRRFTEAVLAPLRPLL